MTAITAADFGNWLAIVSLGLTFVLWGLDKLFEAAESKFGKQLSSPWQQKAQHFIEGMWPYMKFFTGLIMVSYGFYIFYILWSAGLLAL